MDRASPSSPAWNGRPIFRCAYQSSFIKGDALIRAWQEIPQSVIVWLVDAVRTRVLRFALELQDELGAVSDEPAALPKEKVNQHVTNIIYGIHNIFAGAIDGVTQIGSD